MKQNTIERGVVAGAALPAGALSPPLALTDLAALLPGLRDAHQPVVMSLDGGGALRPAAAGVLRAHLAPCHAAATLLLCAGDAGGVRLRAAAAATAGAALPLWFDAALLARLHMPYLTLRHIRGEDEYACDACDATFPEPNWLKVHLWLRCADYERRRFWSLALRLLAAQEASPAPPALHVALLAGPGTAGAAAEAWAAAAGGAAHACVYCGRRYSRRYGLRIHIRTHTGYKPLRCRVCARAFADPSNLNKHARLHARA